LLLSCEVEIKHPFNARVVDSCPSVRLNPSSRAMRRSWGTIVLAQDGTEQSRTIPAFRKKN